MYDKCLRHFKMSFDKCFEPFEGGRGVPKVYSRNLPIFSNYVDSSAPLQCLKAFENFHGKILKINQASKHLKGRLVLHVS